jgi:hypothetical protein
MRARRLVMWCGWPACVAMLVCAAIGVGVASTITAAPSVQTQAFPQAADIEAYRNAVERVFLRDRGGTMPGYAACVMCHTWQTSVRFSLQTPATDTGWTVEQSRHNFAVVTKLVNTADPESSRLLRKPLNASAGGVGHTGGAFWDSRNDPEYLAILKWIRSLPADKYVPGPEPALDFEFFRSCVQPIFANPLEGHIRCSNCHSSGVIGFAPPPQSGSTWTDEEANRAFRTVSRLIIPGNPEQSRFLLKPLHPDGGGSYTHNGPRRWQSRDDAEWRMLAEWVRGQRKGRDCAQ